MEGTNSQRAAPGYDAVAQPAECAPTSSCPAPSRHSHTSSRPTHPLLSFPRRRESPCPAKPAKIPP